jgi:uroporphyrinogen-III synthase
VTDNTKQFRLNLLLTRPLAGSKAFWQVLPHEIGKSLNPIFNPLVEIVPVDCVPRIEGYAIFTSLHGVENSPKGDGRKAFCVGEMTTKAAVAFGWDALQKGETAQQLVIALSKMPDRTVFTHLAGVHTRGNIAERLSAIGYTASHIAVYDQIKCMFSAETNEALASNFPLLVPLFSPRTARVFADQYSGRSPLHIIALSGDVANPIRGLDCKTLTVCERPTRNFMVGAVQKVIANMTLS